MNDEQIAADAATFAYFNRLRRGNSSRAERQAAWAACERVHIRRQHARMRMHPIDPRWQWWDHADEAPTGWTYPNGRTLERDEVAYYFPGALEAFDVHCTDIPTSRFVVNDGPPLRLRLSVPTVIGRDCRATVCWLPEMGIWRRYSRAVKVKPYRVLEAEAP